MSSLHKICVRNGMRYRSSPWIASQTCLERSSSLVLRLRTSPDKPCAWITVFSPIGRCTVFARQSSIDLRTTDFERLPKKLCTNQAPPQESRRCRPRIQFFEHVSDFTITNGGTGVRLVGHNQDAKLPRNSNALSIISSVEADTALRFPISRILGRISFDQKTHIISIGTQIIPVSFNQIYNRFRVALASDCLRNQPAWHVWAASGHLTKMRLVFGL
jgi:hypothetical protein